MAGTQAEFSLPQRSEESEENEQDTETRLHGILLRKLEEAADEVGRARVCYALHLSEGILSKQLRESEEKRPSYRLLAYLVKHQKSGRLARWLVADYAGFLPPQRPEQLEPEEFARTIAAMALGGEFGTAERQKVLDLYARTKRKP